MKKSLKDQLLKAGLVNEKQVQKAKKQAYEQSKKARKEKSAVPDEGALELKAKAAEKAARDRKLNREKELKAQENAIRAQIKQLIEMNRKEKGRGDETFRFTCDGKIKSMYVDEETRKQLSAGRLAIVRFDTAFELVPAPVAEKIATRDASLVVYQFIREKDEHDDNGTDDDPYADYKIPDDLMW